MSATRSEVVNSAILETVETSYSRLNRPVMMDVWRVVSPSSTSYFLDEDRANDIATAYALRDEIAIISEIELPPKSIYIDEDGCVFLVRLLEVA